MSFLPSPCNCDCQNQTIKTELIFVVKKNYDQNQPNHKISPNILSSQSIAMEPKYFQIKRQSLLKPNTVSLVQFDQLKNSIKDKKKEPPEQQKQNYEFALKRFQRNQSQNKFQKGNQVFQKQKSLETATKSYQQPTQEALKQKNMNFFIQNQTHRMTMKKFVNSIKNQNKINDMLLTAKRFKKKQNQIGSHPEPSKWQLQIIEELSAINLLKQKSVKKFNKKNKISKSQYYPDFTIKLMKQEVLILSNELKRLQNEERVLLVQKDQREKFFKEDFMINEIKKESLKKRCKQRFEEIKDLKKILLQCKNRYA